MATMAELPYELLCQIILLLVQSPVGAADFARILSVCKNFLLFAGDENILKLVNFDTRMEFKNFYRYQHVNSLLVKCSEAGNVAAQFLLGKVIILVSSSQLRRWQKCDFHPCDFAKLSEISCILATIVSAHEDEVGSFMAYFLPKLLYTSEFSRRKLVHHQLVKRFLLNGSPYDFIEMSAMATINDLPRELLYYIIFLLVQSIGGAGEFARIIAVSRDFLLSAEVESILRVVNFNVKMEPGNFYRFQNVKGLLVRCSGAGNAAAQHVLGKVIMLSSTHLLLSEPQHVRFSVSYFDRSMLNRWIPDTNVPAQNNKVSTFMTYFTPTQVYTSEFSPTRLVHYQLVKLFLLNGSHHDFIEMGVFLKYCIKYFMGVTFENSPLTASIKLLFRRALLLRSMENLAKTKESFDDYYRGVREFFEGRAENLDGNSEDPSSARSGNSSAMAAESIILLKHYNRKCITVGVHWLEALSDMNFVEGIREDMRNQLNEAYTDFGIIRAKTLGQFESKFG